MFFKKSCNNSPALFIHGFMGDSTEWNEYMTSPKRTGSCKAIDLPGHGSLKEQEISVESAFQNILDNLPGSNRLGTHLIGYSLGGRLALQFALSYPQFINKVTLISTHPGLDGIEEQKKRKNEDEKIAKIITETWPDFLHSWYDNPIWGNLNKENYYKSLISKREQNNPEKLAKIVTSMTLGEQKTLPKLKTYCPFEINWITGSEDKKYTNLVEDIAKVSAKIKHHIIENAGHACHISHVKEVKKIIEN